jgi:hypothetical protein
VHAADADATLARERALLLEALTLLVQRQAETESALADQVVRTTTRVANVERRGAELDARVADIDARLRQLATQVEPDPGLPGRVAVLQAQLQELQLTRTAESTPPTPPPPTAPTEPPPPKSPPPEPAVVAPANTVWERLGATNQDRASAVLIGAGVLVVVFAALAQLRLG